jgi:DNA-binding NtrC family response regulator
LVAEDEPEMLELIRRVLTDEGYSVLPAHSGHEALARLEEGEFDLVLTDVRMPGPDGLAILRRAMARRLAQPVILMTAFGSIASAVEAMREGAYHYLTKPFDLEELLEVVDSAASQIRQLRALKAGDEAADPVFPIVSRSTAMSRLLVMARDIAESNATVLVQGASGTGKELLARAIHRMSRRRDEPFVAVDSTAIPESLLESELFGHRRGSFTGAIADKPGIIAQADRGTLFLDEVGNLSMTLQAKLLRFLQERRYRRVGDVSERSVDVRLLSATNRNLRAAVADGAFREDLFYRLSVITLEIPALRDRREDIPPLVYHFIRRFNAASDYRVEGVRQDAMEALADYGWPGNVRQLENVLERAVILRKAGLIQPGDLPEDVVHARRSQAADARSLEEVERDHILRLLQEFDGNQSRVARILGISRRTVYRKLRSWGIATENGTG